MLYRCHLRWSYLLFLQVPGSLTGYTKDTHITRSVLRYSLLFRVAFEPLEVLIIVSEFALVLSLNACIRSFLQQRMELPLIGRCLVGSERAFIYRDDQGIGLEELGHKPTDPEPLLIVGGIPILELTTNNLFTLQTEDIVKHELDSKDPGYLTGLKVLCYVLLEDATLEVVVAMLLDVLEYKVLHCWII